MGEKVVDNAVKVIFRFFFIVIYLNYLLFINNIFICMRNMSIIPDFELGFWNAWIFMIWLVLLPIVPSIVIKEKKVANKLSSSVPIKFEKTLNVLSTAVVIIGFIYSIFLPITFFTLRFYIGFFVFLLGFAFNISALFTLRYVSSDKPFTTGPYRYSRHPLYISILLIMFSVVIICLSWIFLILIAIVLIHLFLSVPAEEKFCLEKYGEEYRKYLNKTPRWIGLPKK